MPSFKCKSSSIYFIVSITNDTSGIGRSSLSITLRMPISISTHWSRICSRFTRPESGCPPSTLRHLLAQVWDFKPLAESAQGQLVRTGKPRSTEDRPSSRPNKSRPISMHWAKVHEDSRPGPLMLFNQHLISLACRRLRSSSLSPTVIRHSHLPLVTAQAITART